MLTFHSFEIEGVEQVGDDFVIDVDVLANRGSDCLCHRGIAGELATILGRREEFAKRDPLGHVPDMAQAESVAVRIDDSARVARMSAAHIEGVRIAPSPEWLQARLRATGQKPINNVVDATNYVMFSLGQPLHAFDADKLAGGTKTLVARSAHEGEKITTLTKEVYELDPSVLVIADGTNNAPLGIAGIKGGTVAEVTNDTTNIIIEAANFNYVAVRRASRALKLQTDASVRFQNQPAPELTLYALRDVVALILDIAGGTSQGIADLFETPRGQTPIPVSYAAINEVLGVSLDEEEVISILKRFGWEYTINDGGIEVTPPLERTDLTIPEDVIEEIGRIHGYRSLPAQAIEVDERVSTVANPRWLLSQEIRSVLISLGFSEVYTYQLRDTGELQLANALASDKGYVRSSLKEGVREALEKNAYHAPLLGLEKIRIFEIGVVWREGKEEFVLAHGAWLLKKQKGTTHDSLVEDAYAVLAKAIPTLPDEKAIDGIIEVSLENVQPTRAAYDTSQYQQVRYTPISPYPFVLRDIAFWAPDADDATEEFFATLITEQGGSLLIRADLFDTFSKEGKTSYAYHLVFQSQERTLTDEEVNTIMEGISDALIERGCEIR